MFLSVVIVVLLFDFLFGFEYVTWKGTHPANRRQGDLGLWKFLK